MSCLLQLSSARGRDGESTTATGSGEPTRGPARVASAPPSGWVDSYPWPSWKVDGGGSWANYSQRSSLKQEGAGGDFSPNRVPRGVGTGAPALVCCEPIARPHSSVVRLLWCYDCGRDALQPHVRTGGDP